MSFRDIKGQDNAILFLKGSIRKNRVSHAYIFLGPRGVGKRLTALNFAKALNCGSETPDRPCDMCNSCEKIDNLRHPDLFLLKSEKDNSIIKIDAIRGLIKNMTLKPYEAKKKVCIIDDAHLMNQEASNALLKTLEEPPSESILILIADRSDDLFPTIVSRCQIVKFFPLSIEEVKKILINEHKVDELKAHILSHIASGSIGEALRYSQTDIESIKMKMGNLYICGKFIIPWKSAAGP